VGLADVVMPEDIVQSRICGDSAGVLYWCCGSCICLMQNAFALLWHIYGTDSIVLLIPMPVMSPYCFQ
jgi:hypothetical protein